jgi:predicted phage-related endonuclease
MLVEFNQFPLLQIHHLPSADIAQVPTQERQACDGTYVFQSKMRLSEEFLHLNDICPCPDPAEVERSTRDQALSPRWHQERKNRLTASNFGLVYRRKKKPTPAFMATLFTPKSLHTRPVVHGRTYEKTAKQEYVTRNPGAHLHDCGFVISENMSFLGATPDAIVCSNGLRGILEVKAPYTARNMTIKEACKSSTFCLNHNEVSDQIVLKESHIYFAQVQGQLMITGADFCDFVVYTFQDFFVQRILPDFNFIENLLNTLCRFYNDHALEYCKT